MKNNIFSNLSKSILMILCVAAYSSCVNEEYDVEDINTEITVGSEGMSLPLGSTRQLTLKNMLSGMDADMLNVLDGGAYALRIQDTLELGENLPDLESMLNIPDIEVGYSTTFSLSGIDEETMSIDEQEFGYEFELADKGIVPEVNLPEIFIEHVDTTGVWRYGKAAREMEVEVQDVHLNTKKLFDAPAAGGVGNADVALGNVPEAVVDPVEVNVQIKSESPEGISNISDVLMSSSSIISVKLSLVNSFLSEGEVVPDMVLDLGGLLSLEGGAESIDIDDEFTLDAENGYVASKDFRIGKINIEAEDWNGAVLDKSHSLNVSGKAGLVAAKTNAQKLTGYSGGMSLRVDVEFRDLVIASMMMDVAEKEVTEEMDIPITLDEIVLPEGVKSIDRVTFMNESCLDLIIDLQNLSDIEGLETKLTSLEMTFPEEFVVREADADNKVVLHDVDLSGGMDEKIHIDEIRLPAPENGKINYTAHVLVEAHMTAGGRICSADVPYEKENDGVFVVDAESHFLLDDYFVQLESLEHVLDVEPQEFRYDLPDGVADIGTFSVIPEGSPVLNVTLALPQTDLPVSAGKDGIVMSFPEFLKFKDVDPAFGFDPAANSITLSGELPENIVMPIDKIVVTPEKDAETQKYFAEGQIMISGSVTVPDGEVSGNNLEEIATSSAEIKAVVPAIEAEKIEFDHFEIEMAEEISVSLIKAGDLPDEVKKISEVRLADVALDLDVTVDNLPKLGVDPDVNIVIAMPAEIILDEDDDRVNGNEVTIAGKINEGKLLIDPIAIKAIDLSSYDLSEGKDLFADMTVTGSLVAENPDLDLDTIEKDIVLNFNAELKDMDIESVEANVAYEIEGINEQMQLSGLPDFMKGENFVLDLVNPHLVIKAKTNMGIPVKGELLINPIIGGVAGIESQVRTTIELPYTETAEKIDSVTYWFGADRNACPQDYVFCEADISKLIRRIPDELQLSLVAYTDESITSVVEPSAEYSLDVEYDFIVPLEFGEDLHIEICDTLNGLPDILGQMLKKSTVQLAGDITSSLPLGLELNVEMMDENGELIEMSAPAVQSISPCASNGDASVTDLDLTLKVAEGASVENFSSLRLRFVVTSPNYQGHPIAEDDFVQANLKLTLPEGITLDVAGL